MIESADQCPACGGRLVPMVHGLRGPDLTNLVILGGCLINYDIVTDRSFDPAYGCVHCGIRYFDDADD